MYIQNEFNIEGCVYLISVYSMNVNEQVSDFPL